MIDPKRIEEHIKQTWCDDWQKHHRERILATGVSSISEFLRKHPAEPYHKLAKYLDGPVAAVQFIKLNFDEAIARGTAREACKDLLVRTLNDDLKRGWQRGFHWESNRAGAYAHFVTFIWGPDEYRDFGERVWDALKGLDPPPDWIPQSIDDPLIEKAFDLGWPEHPKPAQPP